MSENEPAKEERGTLNKCQWATIYAGTNPKTFFVQLFGSIPSTAKLEVEVNGKVEGILSQKNPKMHANGTKIRLHSSGPEPQGYNYYPV